AGRDGRTDLSALGASVEHHAAIVFGSIEALRPPAERTPEPAAGPFDRAAAGAALERLTAALHDYDLSSASDALADLGSTGLPAAAADDLRRLRRAVDAYEYDQARGIASSLLERVRPADQ
ncbi:MAG TPA: hypothetical protein VNG89_11960, partial [Vicinamibacterales bacterium]|nr:hypothetical protein [Vicinamibacterales bacterium]